MNTANLDEIDHIALVVGDIEPAVQWYREVFKCEVDYQGETWAMLQFQDVGLALVTEGQHPPHVGLRSVTAADRGPLKTHHDGTRSTYTRDPFGNAIEMIAEDE